MEVTQLRKCTNGKAQRIREQLLFDFLILEFGSRHVNGVEAHEKFMQIWGLFITLEEMCAALAALAEAEKAQVVKVDGPVVRYLIIDSYVLA